MTPVLAGLALLLIKHFLGDFVLTTPRQLEEKKTYGARGGLEHAGVHAGLSLPCLLLVGVGIVPALVAVLAEFAVHYHLDWGKERLGRMRSYTPAHRAYWVLFGGDQLGHHLTYVVMIWMLL
jgi:hypothetical protein